MQLQDVKDGFDDLGVFMIGMSQEEKDLSRALEMAAKTRVKFPLVHDVMRQTAPGFDRTNAYFLDEEGIVRQVFPMSAYMRPSSTLVLDEIARILESDGKRAASEETSTQVK